MSLTKYKTKRKFKETPEPKGKVKLATSKLAFVVQRHKASHLHYDLRLEMDGVLKSWAIPKGPSLNPKDKRLAVLVEDHPYDYKDFSGVIPEGNYGAGIVEIWDKGTYSDIENSDNKTAEKKLKAGLKAGSLKFRLNGRKLKGEFALVRLKSDDKAWLLIKHKDEHSSNAKYDSEEFTPKNSPINKWIEGHKTASRSRRPAPKKTAKKKVKSQGLVNTRKLSNYIPPMLAKETDEPFDASDWIFEIKWDGYRAIAEVNNKNIKLYSRNGNSFAEDYPLITRELAKLGINAVLDGEIIVEDEDGKPSFQKLQYYDSNPNLPILYHVFDVLFIKGKNICNLPLIERKALLKKLLPKNQVIRYSDHIEQRGKDFFKVAVKQDLEGIMGKLANSEYYPGKRTSSWLKIKNHKTTEAIVCGFTEPTGSRKNFGALILGIHDGETLKYIGHTGTGFTESTLSELMKLLKPLVTSRSPFKDAIKTNTPVTWVRPTTVCEIKFTEWTNDQHLRHPVFMHLRPDKKPKEVNMASIKSISKTKAEIKASKKTTKIVSKKTEKKAVKKTVRKGSEKKSPDKKSSDKKEGTVTIGNIQVKISNPYKNFWPGEGITKGDVVKYYLEMADHILPYLKDRPQSMKRNPNGIIDEGFFHKDAGEAAPKWVETKKIYSESADKDIDYILCNNKATLAYMNNLGCIEINPWHSTVSKPDHPDYMILDIDPSEKNTFDQVIETANVIHRILKKAGAESFCKTSGATGMHVYVPLGGKYTYDQVKDFAQLVCMLTHEQIPGFTSLERNLKKRGKNNIYLDHLQNRRGQTIACAYSLRPKKGATVSMPLLWTEVKKGLLPSQFTIHNAAKRVKKMGDIFKGILGKGINIDQCLKKLKK